jgi:hypothetical protein
VAGCIFNSICLAILLKVMHKETSFYQYSIIKIASHFGILLTSTLNPAFFCMNCNFSQSFAIEMLRLILLIFINNVLNTISTLYEIIISYDRLCLFKKNTSWFTKVSFNVSLLIILSLAICLNIPLLIGFNIALIGPNAFAMIPSNFGTSLFYRIYGIIMSVFIP